jgi:hypothetical protein
LRSRSGARWTSSSAGSSVSCASACRSFPDEVVLKGPLWNATLVVRGPIHLKGPGGEIVWENRYVLSGRMSWGNLREYEVYEDTQRSAALDDYLARAGHPDGERPGGRYALSA